MLRFAIRLGAVLACVVAFGVAAATPAAAARGVVLQMTELAPQFGAGSTQVTVVAAKNSGTDCLKVRWSLLLQAQGFRLDQVAVGRIEDSGPFPVAVDRSGNAARFTDTAPDPGTLCRDRTVTARYTLNFNTDVTRGLLQLTAEAYDVNLQLLERTTATRVVLGSAASTAPTVEPRPRTPAATSSTSGNASGRSGTSGDEITPLRTTDPASAGQRTSATGGLRLLPVGLAVGGVLLFLGFGLLLKLVWRRPGRPADGVDRDGSGGRHRPDAGSPLAAEPPARQWGDPTWTQLSGRTPETR